MTEPRPYARTEQVQTTLKTEERERLDAVAAAEPASRANLVRRFILEGVEREERKTLRGLK